MSDTHDAVIGKIKALLRLAEDSRERGSLHEAEAAAARASEMVQRYRLDVAWVVVMYPDKAPEAIMLPGAGTEEQLGAVFRKIVGGWLERVSLGSSDFYPGALPPDTILYCNEEGKLQGLPASFPIPGDVVRGPVVATGLDEHGGTRSLTEEEAAAICRLLTTLRSFGGVT